MKPSRPDVRSDTRSASDIKDPYLKPAFRHEQIFETMALACGKISTTQQQCKTAMKSS